MVKPRTTYVEVEMFVSRLLGYGIIGPGEALVELASEYGVIDRANLGIPQPPFKLEWLENRDIREFI